MKAINVANALVVHKASALLVQQNPPNYKQEN